MPGRPERIETERLVLVPLPVAMARSIAGGDLSVVEHAEGWPHADTLDAVRMAARDEDPWPVWLVTLDGCVIGDCGTAGPVDASDDVEIGYGLAAEHRGRGYGAELVGALSLWLLGRPGVRRVVAQVAAGNIPSRRALERVGFEPLRSDDDHVTYAFAVPPPA
jgi:RimJ/RimL family protein N-acetyltransferase